MIGLEAVGQNAMDQMSRQVRRRLAPEHGVPASPKITDVEIAKARDLGVECLLVR